MTPRRLRVGGFPDLDGISELDYDGLVRLECAFTDYINAADNFTDAFCELQSLHHPMMVQLDALAEADPRIVDRVAAALARSRPGGRHRPGDLGRAEESLAQGAHRHAVLHLATPPGTASPDPLGHRLRGPFAGLYEDES